MDNALRDRMSEHNALRDELVQWDNYKDWQTDHYASGCLKQNTSTSLQLKFCELAKHQDYYYTNEQQVLTKMQQLVNTV